ncbi:serine/threonine-protein kinase [Ruegeria sp. HKCCD7255]|uniref:serine/threonine-protein kinase n=1 Tax=Ruegeria sp. HKCCD7255 TaxID=2683004 RepID=UPI0014890942|nr:serine/threonine-protein kinase [Ruegeria sp. HKCCD7255]
MTGLKKNEYVEEEQTFVDELKPGTELMHRQFRIERFLNAGGFGITYEAKDSLNRRVVIKECFPGAFCRRSVVQVVARSRAHQQDLASIVKLFVREARSLAKLKHPNIVGVHQVFEENNTAYMALDFVDGRDLLQIIEDKHTNLSPALIEEILTNLLDAVAFVHNQNVLHRDISPDNILLDLNDRPVLIDFGAAREEATKQSRVLTAMRVVKDGYSPQEFYIAGSEQGPHSDLYALGASFYHLISGEVPPNSQARLSAAAAGDPDPYQPLEGRFDDYNPKFLAALDKSLAILPKDRMASAEDWQAMIKGLAPNSADVVVLAYGSTPKPANEVKAEQQQELQKGKSRTGLLLASAAVVAIAAVGVAYQSSQPGGLDLGSLTGNSVAVTAEPNTATAEDAAEVAAATPSQAETAPALPASPVSETQPADDTTLEAPAPTIADATRAEPPETVAEPEVSALAVAEAVPASPESVARTEVATDIPAAKIQPAETNQPASKVAASEIVTPNTSDDYTTELASLFNPAGLVVDLSSITTNVEAAVENTPPTASTPVAKPEPAAIDTKIIPEIPAQNDIEIAGLQSERLVQLPYERLLDASKGEMRIFAVNGTPVASRDDFNAVTKGLLANSDRSTLEVTVSIGVTTADAREQTLTLPVFQRVTLSNGLVFNTSYQGDSWITRVAAVPDELNLDMRPGDILYGYLITNELLTGPYAVETILEEQVGQGKTSFSFAVKRGEDIWAVAFPFDGNAPIVTATATQTSKR